MLKLRPAYPRYMRSSASSGLTIISVGIACCVFAMAVVIAVGIAATY